MSLKVVNENVIKEIADALREADDNPNARYTPANFPAAISRVSALGGQHDITFRNAVGNIPRRTFVSEIRNFLLGDLYPEPNSTNPKRENVLEGHTIVARLTDTKFVMVYKQQAEIRAIIGNINDTVINYGVPHVLQRIVADDAPQDFFAKVHHMKIAVLSPTRVVISFGSTAIRPGYQYGKLKAFMALQINGNLIQEETALAVVHEPGDYTSLLPVTEDTVLVVTYDGSYGKMFMLKVIGNGITYHKNKVDIGGCNNIYNNYSMTLLSDSMVAVTVTFNNQVWVHPYVINEEGIAKKYPSAVFDLAGAYNIATALINENRFLLCVGAQGKVYSRTVALAQNTTFGRMDEAMIEGIWYQLNLARINAHSFVLGLFTNSLENDGYFTNTIGLEVNGDRVELTLEQSHQGTCYGVVEHMAGNKVLMCYTRIYSVAVECTILIARSGVVVADGSKPIFGLTTVAANDGTMATIAIPRGGH